MLRPIAHFLIDPVNLLLLGVLGIVVLSRFGWLRAALAGKVLLAGVLFLIFLTPYPAYLTIQHEQQFAPLDWDDLPSEPYRIVILGSGYGRDTTLRPTQRLSSHATGRMLEGYRIYREQPMPIVTSGYSRRDIYSQAEVTAEALVDLGVRASDTLWMDHSHNTREEALIYAQRWGQDLPVVLVTDALHMKRAVGWFRHFGVEVIPAPTNFTLQRDHYAPDGDVWDLGFQWIEWKNLERMQRLFHEWAGWTHLRWEQGSSER